MVQWIYCDMFHFPSLPLLSFHSVNLQLTCFQANPQIQFHSYHHGSPHMTLKAIFHKLNGNFLKTFYSSQHDTLVLAFLSGVLLIKNNFLYHQTKSFQQYHVKQTKFRLIKRLNSYPHGTSALWSSTLIIYSKQRVFHFL